ncbi:hypothetical protein ROHU_002419 [Labeo rohita]|uniref:Uncharacterized protein n=1 Tax=Labeo rohita TaxID=84645 RepID=A0A498NYP9_LABRO|nr:hypothetical protein ROHU_002419 [Labeo rohita]
MGLSNSLRICIANVLPCSSEQDLWTRPAACELDRSTRSSHLWENLPAAPFPEEPEPEFEDPELFAEAAERGRLKDLGPGGK